MTSNSACIQFGGEGVHQVDPLYGVTRSHSPVLQSMSIASKCLCSSDAGWYHASLVCILGALFCMLGVCRSAQTLCSDVCCRFPEDDSGSMTHTIATLAANRAHEQYARHLNLGRYLASNLKYMRPGFRSDLQPSTSCHPFRIQVSDCGYQDIYLDVCPQHFEHVYRTLRSVNHEQTSKQVIYLRTVAVHKASLPHCCYKVHMLLTRGVKRISKTPEHALSTCYICIRLPGLQKL